MIEEPEYGPAMMALTDLQRRFVLAMLEIPGCSHARAAREAGYSDASEAAKVRGHYCAHNPAVQAALREEAGKRLNGLSVIAANVMMDIMLDEDGDPKTKLKAASAVLDRTGFAAVQKIDVTRKDESATAVLDQIQRLSQKLGIPVRQLLTKPAAAVVDGEFTEVSDG
jgi:phage terminase small subunit